MKEIIYYCDVCGERFEGKNRAPWDPELCTKHLMKYKKDVEKMSVYASKKEDEDIQVWLKTD